MLWTFAQDSLKNIHKQIAFTILPFSENNQVWLQAIILGELDRSIIDLYEIFKFFGIYHFLVISGFHINFIFRLLFYGLNGLNNLLYIVRIINPQYYLIVRRIIEYSSLGFISVYGAVLGMPPPVQRSILFLSASHIFYLKNAYKLMICLILQMVIFKNSIFSISNILSWVSYLIITLKAGEYYRKEKFQQKFLKQCAIVFICAFIFGELSIIGIFLNLYIEKFLTLFLVGSYFLYLSYYLNNDLFDLMDKSFDIFWQILEVFYEKLSCYKIFYCNFIEDLALRSLFLILALIIFIKFLNYRPIDQWVVRDSTEIGIKQ